MLVLWVLELVRHHLRGLVCWVDWDYCLDKVFISAGLASRSSSRSSQWWRVVRTRCRNNRGIITMYVHVLLGGAGVDTVPLVDVDLRDVLPAIILDVVWNSCVVA